MIDTIDNYLSSQVYFSLGGSSKKLYLSVLNKLKGFVSNQGTDNVSLDSFPMDEFVEWLKGYEISGRSIQQYLTIVKIFFKWAGHPIEYTYRIPADERKEAKQKSLDRWFDEGEIAMCLGYDFPDAQNESLRVRNQAIVRLLIETGMRVQELANVRSENIDLDDCVMLVSESKTVPRPVFFTWETKDLLVKVRISQRGVFDTDWTNQKVFPSVNQIQKVINDMLVDMGLKNGSDGRGPHTFRHWTATSLFYDGQMRLEDIAFLLGDQPETIRSTYLHPTTRMLQRCWLDATKRSNR